MPGQVRRGLTVRLRATSPSPEGVCTWRGRRVVSWLRAAALAFPTEVSGMLERAYYTTCPLQWRGRTGIAPVSGSPVRFRIVSRI